MPLRAIRMPARAPWRLRALLPLTLLGMTAWGCDLPQAPKWNVDLLVPFSQQSLGIDSLLPYGVSVRSVGGERAFMVDPVEDSAHYSLGEMCEPCRPLQGSTAPVPGFDYADTLHIGFPSGLLSMDVVTATLGFRVTNGLDFDPLRPTSDPGTAGWVQVEAIDAGSGAVLDSVFISGADESLPAGATRTLALRIRDASLSGGVIVAAAIHSPYDGQTATVDTAATFDVEPVSDSIAVSAVTVEVQNGRLSNSYEIQFDSSVRDDVADRIQEATVDLELQHALDISGTLDVSLAGSVQDLFGGPGREIRLDPVDFSYAPEGRTITQTLSAEEVQFLAGLPQIYLGLSAVASARTLDAQGRPAVKFLPTDSAITRLKISANVEVNN